MIEAYLLGLEGSSLTFSPLSDKDCPSVDFGRGKPLIPPKGMSLAARMGDPDLVHCAVFKNEHTPGGFFALADRDGPLFLAVAKTNLVFAIAQGFFGELTANARYGVDVFENMELPND